MNEFSETGDPRFTGWVRENWGISFTRYREDIPIDGSPERALSRAVAEDEAGGLHLLEKFPKTRFRIRNRVAQTQHCLYRNGLTQTLAARKTISGEFLPVFRDHCFQISPFVTGTGLDRPDWLSSGAMGEEMAGFLIRMHGISSKVPDRAAFPEFSIKTYIYRLFRDMETHDPGRAEQYRPFLLFLEQEFMAAHDSLPQGFVHGDFHPLNIIWDGHRIRAVIDWEFTGIKPEIYDAANLVGCAGIEHPNGLAMPLVSSFLARLRTSGIIRGRGRQYFLEYVLALRFAWLSEWLRKKDLEMLETEAAFMNILVDHRDDLKSMWDLDEKG